MKKNFFMFSANLFLIKRSLSWIRVVLLGNFSLLAGKQQHGEIFKRMKISTLVQLVRDEIFVSTRKFPREISSSRWRSFKWKKSTLWKRRKTMKMVKRANEEKKITRNFSLFDGKDSFRASRLPIESSRNEDFDDDLDGSTTRSTLHRFASKFVATKNHNTEIRTFSLVAL